MQFLSEADFPFTAYQTVADLTFTHEALQVDPPATWSLRVAQFANHPAITNVALDLIADSWEIAPDGFKIQLVSEMQTIINADSFVYTPEHYTLLLQLINYVYHISVAS